MKIFLTGANGFTGKYFSELAKSEGHQIIWLEGDITDRANVTSQIHRARADCVVHLAAISFIAHENISRIYAVNVVGTENVLEATYTAPFTPSKVLLASSANIYGDATNSPITETSLPNPINHYALSKLSGEYIAKRFMNRLPLIVLRPFNYTGPGQDTRFVIPKIVGHFASQAGEIELGNLNVWREYNNVNDTVNAYLSLAQSDFTGIINICSGQSYALQEVIDILQEICGYEIEVKVNKNFVRPNEIRELYGDPSKLKKIVPQLHFTPIKKTLETMLSHARAN